jgi:hypothetical protein
MTCRVGRICISQTSRINIASHWEPEKLTLRKNVSANGSPINSGKYRVAISSCPIFFHCEYKIYSISLIIFMISNICAIYSYLCFALRLSIQQIKSRHIVINRHFNPNEYRNPSRDSLLSAEGTQSEIHPGPFSIIRVILYGYPKTRKFQQEPGRDELGKVHDLYNLGCLWNTSLVSTSEKFKR